MSKKGKYPKSHGDNSAMATAFEAYGKTTDGKHIVAEARNIGPRVTALRELAHEAIVELTKSTPEYRSRFYGLMAKRRRAQLPTVKNPFLLFKAAKPVLKEIAIDGGTLYDQITEDFQYLWCSEKSLAETIDMILA